MTNISITYSGIAWAVGSQLVQEQLLSSRVTMGHFVSRILGGIFFMEIHATLSVIQHETPLLQTTAVHRHCLNITIIQEMESWDHNAENTNTSCHKS